MDKETARQLFHMLVGLMALVLLLKLGRGFMIAAVFFTILIGTLLMNAKLLGRRVFFVDWFEERMEREGAPLPGWGSACYALGVLIIITFLSDIDQMAACIFVLAVGDAVSTLIGRMGRYKVPYNSKKTVEGSIAFFISSLPAYFFIGPLAFPLALFGMLAESIPEIDDNVTVPIICTTLLLVLA